MIRFDSVTTYAKRHWEEYARRGVETFDQHWRGVHEFRYEDGDLDGWLQDFKRRHSHLPTDNYRMDAVRFAHKIAAIDKAFYESKADALIWRDADVITHAPVDCEWLSGLLGDADFAYLRRTRKYPECGFMIIRRSDRGAALVNGVVDMYKSDKMFGLREWHDSYVIEHVRASVTDLKCVSMSGDAEDTGHPLVNGPLGERLDHLKGKRKAAGRSLPTDFRAQRSEDYWK